MPVVEVEKMSPINFRTSINSHSRFQLIRLLSLPTTKTSNAPPIQQSVQKTGTTEPEKHISKVAVITGASSGIGMECAAVFSSLGWEVHNISRKPCPVQGVISHAADLTTDSEASRVGNIISEHLSKRTGNKLITVVHNAAMHSNDQANHKFNAELMQKAFTLSVVSPGLLNARLLPWMSPGSSILFVGSTLSEKAVAGRVSYVTTKHAVVGLMRSYVQDLFGTGVHTAVVCPGFTDTPMLRDAMSQTPSADEFVRGFVSLGRLISPAEIAGLIRLAAETPALNGAILHANGGQRET